jgi:acyl-CoA reductase-like NAD-dependent aldehyde dehydrogenase
MATSNYTAISTTLTGTTTGKLIELFATLSDDDVQTVIARAQKAFESTWRKTPINQRAPAMARAAEIMRAKAEELAAHIVTEIGKRVAEARAEVDWSPVSSITMQKTVRPISSLAPFPTRRMLFFTLSR